MLILRKVLFSIIVNFSLFLILVIVIQNNKYKHRVNLLIDETVQLPVSFILGVSFIAGSLSRDLLALSYSKKE